MADFRFTNEHSSSELGNVVSVLNRPRLWIPSSKDYPDYFDWVQKTEAQVTGGDKRAMLGYIGRVPIGAVVYQQHKTRPNMVEIRNISVSPDSRSRYVGSFLLRNTEIEATSHDFPECSGVVVDTKTTNTEMISFLMRHGYQLEEITDLYGLGTGKDAVFVKSVLR